MTCRFKPRPLPPVLIPVATRFVPDIFGQITEEQPEYVSIPQSDWTGFDEWLRAAADKQKGAT